MERGLLAAQRALYGLAERGLAPAEALTQTLRHQLFRELWSRSMTVTEIAALTMTTEYTVVRCLRTKEPS